jgi:hypothetical protein
MNRVGGEEVGNWKLEHASTGPREYKDSVSFGKPELSKSFLGFSDLCTLGHDVRRAHLDVEGEPGSS